MDRIEQLERQIEGMRSDQEYMEMLKELFEHPEAQEGLVELMRRLRSKKD